MSKVMRNLVLPVLILVIAVALTMVMIGAKKAPEKQEAEDKAFLVKAVEVTTKDMNYIVKSQGTVQPKVRTVLSAQVSGKVVKLSDAFVAGGLFQKGDLLIQLEQADYITDFKSAEAELARAKAALEEEQAKGKVAAEEWKSVRDSIAPELGLRKPQLAKEIANVRAAEAQLERAKRNLERTEIRAPYDGLVRSKNVDIGQFVAVGSELGSVYGTDIAEIRMPLSDNDLAYLELSHEGSRESHLPSKVTLSSQVAGKQFAWDARLVRNEGVLDEKNRVIYVVAEVQDPYMRKSAAYDIPLKFGRFVSAQITGNYAENIVVLPRNVLRLDGSVLVVDEERKLHITPVNVQKSDEKLVYISEGLSVGQKVIISAVPNPVENMSVRFAEDSDEADDSTGENAKAGDSL